METYILCEWGDWTVRSKSWNFRREKYFDSSRSSRRRAFAWSGARKLWIILQGVCAAMSSAEYRCRVRPFLVRGFGLVVEDGFVGWICADSEVWILGECVGGAPPGFLVGVDVDVSCDDIVDVAVSTFPSLAVRMSNRASWVMSGKSERSRASFRSVDSSSTDDWTGSSRRRFLETKASIAGVSYVSFVVFD